MSFTKQVKATDEKKLETLYKQYQDFCFIDRASNEEKRKLWEIEQAIHSIEFGTRCAFRYRLNTCYYNIHMDERKQEELKAVIARMVKDGDIPDSDTLELMQDSFNEFHFEVRERL